MVEEEFEYKPIPPKKSYRLSSCCSKCAELGGDYFSLLQKNYYLKLENKALKALMPMDIYLSDLAEKMKEIMAEEEK
jgi:hypothetical protein